jgi:hypothetical protein
MRLSWNEIRARAKVFSKDWEDAHYEKGETQPFYEKFFDIFGVSRRSVGIYEKRVENLETGKRGFIDLFWPGTLIVEQKSAGRNLKAAQSQPRSLLSIAKSKSARSRNRRCSSRKKRIAQTSRGLSGRFAPTILPAFQGRRP